MAIDDQVRDDVAKLAARSIALREIVARLVSYEAIRHGDVGEMLRDFSDFGDKRIARLPPEHMQFAELVRKEFDWVLTMAKAMI